jgi:predicted nucleic acid-binding protein
LGKSNLLGLLKSLYTEVIITEIVFSELDASKNDVLATVNAAIQQGWLVKVAVSIDDPELAEILDPGEVSSILYSLRHGHIPLLIDEYKGRRYAKKQAIPVIGTAGVLIQAKQKNLVPLVKPLLIDMITKGYWLSDEFIDMVPTIAGEK